VGPLAISGLALTFPLMNLSAAFGAMVGVGASTLISMRLGQRDYETAKQVLGNVVILNTVIGVLFAAVMLLFLDPVLYFFGASEATLPYAREYMEIILLGNVITHMYLGLNAVLRAAGHPRKSMYATIITVALNAILDPIFIFGLDWGIRGAAIATILAQIVSLSWQLRILSNKEELLHFRRGIYRLKSKIVEGILSIGLSPFLMNLAACFIAILINKGFKEHGGDLMIGAYGITNRVAFLFVMVMSLFAPWFGREILLWIVDMTSVGAAIVFAYTTASAAIMARKVGDTKQVWIGIVGCIFSLFFLSLLLIPGMPGYLSFQSRVILLVWIVIGFIFYWIIRKNYGEIQRKRKLSR
jgi:putative MATE family efflux protein